MAPFGRSKSCKWSFRPDPKNPANSLCSDKTDTYSFPTVDCKTNLKPTSKPRARGCSSTQFPDIKSGYCPTYSTSGDRPNDIAKKYSCDISTQQGGMVSNLFSCKDGRGTFVSKDIPK
ncbi:secreted protein [Melampsora americana]|nr:secreted protein [Melampsora americana]